MTSAGDPFERLPRSLRTRLDAFSAQVDHRTLADLQMLTFVPDIRSDGGAHERVDEMAGRTRRTEAIDAIREIALDYIAKRYSEVIEDPRRVFLGRSIATRAGGPERARLAASFGDALTAIALSDVLDAADVDVLLGPWAELADAAAAR